MTITKPIATEEQFRREARKWCRMMGLIPPWQVRIYYGMRDKDDPQTYAACEPQPDYYFIQLYFDPTHEGWAKEEEGDISECVRHELFHGFVSPLTELAKRLCSGDKDLEAELNAREEEVVTRLGRMPVWDELD
jgi:hypothetical protein